MGDEARNGESPPQSSAELDAFVEDMLEQMVRRMSRAPYSLLRSISHSSFTSCKNKTHSPHSLRTAHRCITFTLLLSSIHSFTLFAKLPIRYSKLVSTTWGIPFSGEWMKWENEWTSWKATLEAS
jgi:hypothetical protein